MRLQVRKIDNSFAREVVGLRLWEVPERETVDEIRRLWADHGVLVFRRQALSEAELATFSAAFGQLERVVRTDWASNIQPEVGIISNLRDADSAPIGGLGSGEVKWHSDQSYVSDPATGCLLYAVELPGDGGVTSWASLTTASEALPDRLRAAITGKRAIYSYAKRLAGYSAVDAAISPEMKARTPDVTHLLLQRHPVTGREALYFDPTTMVGIVGMETDAALALLDELTAFVTRPEFVYHHHWQVGDVVMWDNGFLLHRRELFDSKQRRLMKRTTLALPRNLHIVPQGQLAA